MRLSAASVAAAVIAAVTVMFAVSASSSTAPTVAPATVAHAPVAHDPLPPRSPVPNHPLLSNGDCGHVNGTVVVITDDRCGGTHAYCRMPDGNAVCIDTMDKTPN